ncbi:hypothetical protein X801_01490 [Opisthorchis viverrini]|uniref:Dynein regulatory complex protein 10 n=2 Tax=Opisthorchis viverrini TaxID=6198 RepID=A0A1S8X7E0_OPIVI|nr:hypothetical protein X801_01490 [Opisthorchis viverrini]
MSWQSMGEVMHHAALCPSPRNSSSRHLRCLRPFMLNQECSKEDEDLHILISEFEELAEKYDIFACNNCTQPTIEAKHKKRGKTQEKEFEDAFGQQDCDSIKLSGNSSQGFEVEATHQRFANQEVQTNSVGKSELQDELLHLTRQIAKKMNQSPYAKELMQQIVAVNPKSSYSDSLLNLPYSVFRRTESVPEITLLSTLEEQKHNFMTLLLRLRSVCFAELLSTPEDRKRKKKFVKEIHVRLNESLDRIEKLSQELDQLNERNKREDEKTSNRVESLQNEMNNLQNYMKARVKRTVDEEQQRKNLILQKSQEKQTELEKELHGLKASYSKLVEDNQKVEVRQRNQVYKMETELESVIQKFDREMMALQSEYDQLDEEYTNDKLELTELEEKFSTLEEEYLKIMEKRRLEEEKRKQEEEEQRVLEEGVTMIQAFWRSYQTRKAVRGRRDGSQKRKR